MDKAPGEPCPNLTVQGMCAIHEELGARGFPGCVAYSCFGAGPCVTAAHHPLGWRTDPDAGTATFAAFGVQRALHELLWHLRAARAERVGTSTRIRLDLLHARTEDLARLLPDQPEAGEIETHREAVAEALRAASAELRGPTPGPDLRGRDLVGAKLAGRDLRRASLRGALMMGADLRQADLRRADLRRADLAGADLRGADLAGADLRGVLFLTPSQLRSARVTSATRLDPRAGPAPTAPLPGEPR